jgi:retron-type reverse transcriptase
MKDLETKLFTEQHTKEILTGEKQILSDKVSNLKASNMAMARTITKDKYHNNREEIEKERKKAIDDTKSAIASLTEKIEG